MLNSLSASHLQKLWSYHSLTPTSPLNQPQRNNFMETALVTAR